jgi:hypothetical protein
MCADDVICWSLGVNELTALQPIELCILTQWQWHFFPRPVVNCMVLLSPVDATPRSHTQEFHRNNYINFLPAKRTKSKVPRRQKTLEPWVSTQKHFLVKSMTEKTFSGFVRGLSMIAKINFTRVSHSLTCVCCSRNWALLLRKVIERLRHKSPKIHISIALRYRSRSIDHNRSIYWRPNKR